jgi:hypothetical protein
MRAYAVDFAIRGPIQGRVRLNGGGVITIGTRVRVARPGWFDKVGTYAGKDRRSQKLKVQFEENGRAMLFCERCELTAIIEPTSHEQVATGQVRFGD